MHAMSAVEMTVSMSLKGRVGAGHALPVARQRRARKVAMWSRLTGSLGAKVVGEVPVVMPRP